MCIVLKVTFTLSNFYQSCLTDFSKHITWVGWHYSFHFNGFI